MKKLQLEYHQQRNGNRHEEQESRRPRAYSRTPELCIMATGGGAFKYYDKIKDALGTEVVREDEMECLIIGMALHLLSFYELRILILH